MTTTVTCSDASAAAGEALGGTASRASRWLLVEVRGAWGRDAVADSGLPDDVRETLGGFPGSVILIRRPDRRAGVTIIHATASEEGGTARRQEVASLDEIPRVDLEGGEPIAGALLLVCSHGRRDACCARLGVPLFDAFTERVPRTHLWQASHLGGHRFAPNVLVVPHGLQFGRIPVTRGIELAGALAEGRIPLDLYRGRTIYEPHVQAAEITIRTARDLDRVDDLSFVSQDGERVTFSTPTGVVTALVSEIEGPNVPASCGKDPEPTVAWVASLESAS